MSLLEACCDSRELLETILSCLQVPIMVADLEGNIFFAGPAVEPVLGYPPHELRGLNLSVIFTPEDLTFLYPNLLHLANKNQAFEGEIMLKHKSEARFSAFIAIQPCFDPCQGKTIMVIFIYEVDKGQVTKKAFRQDHYEDLVRIANGIAHELRNPLVGIGGFVTRLYKSCRLSSDHDTYYGYIVSNLKKIESLVHKVELFASLPKPCFAEKTIDQVVNAAVQPFLSKIESSKIRLSVDLEKVSLFVDTDLAVRAVSILLDNALDALSDGGSITIRAEKKDNQCIVSITDTGCGISPEDFPFIFNPFFSTKPDGAGIDLALVKRIMEGHGGYVEASSKRGEGTIFSLIFPIERRRSLRICHLQG